MHVLEDLDGVNVARGLVAPSVVALTLMSPKYTVDGAGFAAESFAITSLDGLRSLHDLLGRMISAAEELSEEGGES